MNIDTYREYVRRFNEQDAGTFDAYLTPDVTVQNGRLRYQGLQSMKDHYARIWRSFRETLHIVSFVSDGSTMAVHLNTHFDVLCNDAASPFGAVSKGEQFDYDGIVLYALAGGRIRDIKISYLDFVKMTLDGHRTSLGIVH